MPLFVEASVKKMTGQAKKSVPFLAGSGKISDRSEPA